MLNKKGVMATIFGVVLIIIVITWLIFITTRECSENKDCEENQYCGADHLCYDFPIIEKEVIRNNLLWPSIIIGIAIVIGAVILRYKRWMKEPIS